MKLREQGFTLIELMIVITILAILAAIAIPQYQTYVGRGQVAEAFSLLDGLKTAVASGATENGGLTGVNNSTFDVPAATDMQGDYVAQVAVANGIMTATLRGAAPVQTPLQGKTLIMVPTVHGTGNGSVSWDCSIAGAGGTVPSQYRPSICR